MTDYLTVVEVLAIHDDQIERYGGASGVRDRGLLEAAIFRPQSGYYADLIEEAAALWESLSQPPPSWTATAHRLRCNVYRPCHKRDPTDRKLWRDRSFRAYPLRPPRCGFENALRADKEWGTERAQRYAPFCRACCPEIGLTTYYRGI